MSISYPPSTINIYFSPPGAAQAIGREDSSHRREIGSEEKRGSRLVLQSAPEAEAHEVRGAALTECRTDAGVRGTSGSGGDAAAAAPAAGGGGQRHCARLCWRGLWVLREKD